MELVNEGRRASLTDYARLRTALEMHGQFSGEFGILNGIRYEAWVINTHGVIVATNGRGRIGLYGFVGKFAAPVENDLAYIEELAKRK